MRKKLFMVVSILFLFIFLTNNSHATELLSGEANEYSVSIKNGDSDSTSMTVKGYMIYEKFDLSQYKMAILEYSSSNSNVGYLLSNKSYVKTAYYELTDFEGKYEIVDKIYTAFDTQEYQYLYFIKYENKTISPRATATFKLSYTYLYLEGLDYYDVIYHGETQFTIDDTLHDVSDLRDYVTVIAPYDVEITLISDNYTSNYNKSGSYYVTYSVIGKEYDEEFSILFIVKTNKLPEIEEGDAVTVIDVDNMISLETIKSYFTATDYEDGDITANIVFETNYDENVKKVGEYYLLSTITDSDGNTVTLNTKIYVIDTAPPIVYNSVVEVNNNKQYSYDEIFELMDVRDNYATTFTYEIITDEYSDNYNMPGKHYIEYNISDGYNYNQTTVEIIVKDLISPVLNITNITTSHTVKVTTEEMYDNISVIEDSSYEITLDTSAYDASYNKRGDYKVLVSVTDNAGNITTGELIITVTSNELPVIYYNNSVRVYSDTILTHDNLIAFLKEISTTSYDETAVSVVESDYFKTPSKVGEYNVVMTTTFSDGSVVKENYSILVLANQVTTTKRSFLSKIGYFFKKLGRSIVNFFKKIFSFLF
ncbi:MAG: hypothetical protein ACI35W_07605 [Anaeroplasmataceae bacterium]